MNTYQDKRISLLRDVEASMVPSGDKVTLVAGNLVQITQSLGGNYTIIINGNMAQISANNADALGIKLEKIDTDKSNLEFSEQLVWDQLKTCYDPEIPVNIVDLGLIYDLFFTMSHGVNRGILKANKTDERYPFLDKLIKKNPIH